MSTGKVIFGFALAAILIGSVAKKKENSKSEILKKGLKPMFYPGSNPDLTIFDTMNDQELQLLIDILIDKKYIAPFTKDVQLQLDKILPKIQHLPFIKR